MKGKFRRARTRCARRMGINEEVKFAEARRASVDNGGRPCLFDDKYNSQQRSRIASITLLDPRVSIDGLAAQQGRRVVDRRPRRRWEDVTKVCQQANGPQQTRLFADMSICGDEVCESYRTRSPSTFET